MSHKKNQDMQKTMLSGVEGKINDCFGCIKFSKSGFQRYYCKLYHCDLDTLDYVNARPISKCRYKHVRYGGSIYAIPITRG